MRAPPTVIGASEKPPEMDIDASSKHSCPEIDSKRGEEEEGEE